MSDVVPIVGRGYCYEDLKVGFRFRTHRRTIAESDVANFVNLTWLTEELFAVADDSQRAIKGRPVPGALIYSFAEGLLLPTMQDTGLAFLNATVDIKAPTVVGDTIQVYVDGKLINEFKEEAGRQPGKDFERKLNAGTIALQAHDPKSVVLYKNIRIKALN